MLKYSHPLIIKEQLLADKHLNKLLRQFQFAAQKYNLQKA
jgi:hypothetical protein